MLRVGMDDVVNAEKRKCKLQVLLVNYVKLLIINEMLNINSM